MGLFTKKDLRVVKWALPGEYIPLKCEICGAIFATKNRGPIGSEAVVYGKDYNLAQNCERKKHHLIHLVPNKKVYLTQDY